MTDVYIKNVEGGETTTPAGSEGVELDSGTNSTWISLINLAVYVWNYLTSLTAKTTPVGGDQIGIADSEASNAAKKVTIENFFKVINNLTSDASPDTLADYVVTYDTSASAAKKVLLSSIGGGEFKNRLINGDFSIAQRGTAFTAATSFLNSDDLYLLDRWYMLSDGNDIADVTQETTTVPTNELYAIALDVETINKKFGIAQIVEQKNCIGLIGQTVTFSFKAKVSSTTKLDNVKCAIIAWSGTADSVTSDVISAWNAEGTNPTLIANATYENTPANLNLTTSYATYSVSAAVDTASAKNIIVFIWSDVTDTTLSDFIYIADAQLEVGSSASSFERRAFLLETILCQRYLLPLTYDPNTSAYLYPPYGVRVSTNLIDTMIQFPYSMFANPTLKTSTPTYNSSLSGNQIAFFNNNSGAFSVITGSLTLSISNVGTTGCTFRATAGTSWDGSSGNMGNWYFGNTAAILLEAEL